MSQQEESTVKQAGVMSPEETVREYLTEHPGACFVNREVFCPVWHKIRPLLDYDILCPILLLNKGLLRGEEDELRFRNSFEQPHDRHIALIDLVQREMGYGYMLLYIYICETITSPGHSEAARILTEIAQQKKIPPPYERVTRRKSKSVPFSSSPRKSEEVITDRHLAEMAAELKKWEVLRPYLSLSEADEVEIKKDGQGFYGEQKHDCLRKWRKKFGDKASYCSLMRAALACESQEVEMVVLYLLALPGIGEELKELRDSNNGQHLVSNRKYDYQRWLSESSGYSSSSDYDRHLAHISSDPNIEVFIDEVESDSDKFVKIDSDFSRLSNKFTSLVISLLAHLDEQNIKLIEIKNHMDFLPLHLKEELFVPIMQVGNELDRVKTIRKFFKILDDHVWNFVDYHLLEHITLAFGSDKLKRRVEQYAAELAVFERETSVYDFVKRWPGRKKAPNFNQGRAKIKQDSKSCTIKQLNEYRKILCEAFWPPLSEYAKYVIYYNKIGDGCIEVTWSYPPQLTAKLQEFLKSPKALEFFERNQIESVEILDSKSTPSESPMPRHMLEVTRADSPSKMSHSDYYSMDSESLKERDLYSDCSSGSSTGSKDFGSMTPLSQLELDAENNLSSPCDPVELNKRLVPLQEPLNAVDSALSVKFGKRLKRNKRRYTDGGCYPSIALNNDGIVAEVKHQAATNLMFCRVGQVKNDVIQWGNPSSRKGMKKKFICSGAYPRVAMNDSNTVIEIHKGQILDRCCYRVGRVNLSKMKIDWGPSNHLNVGLRPDVAINSRNTLITVFRENVFTKFLYYRVLQLSTTTNEIVWMAKKKQKIPDVMAEVVSVDMNDNGFVVLSYQVPVTNHIHYRVGRLSMPSGVIDWSKISHKCNGFTPSICINNKDQVVLIHQSLARRHLVSNVGVARWEEDFKGIDWSLVKGTSNCHYGKGIYPSVAMDDNGHVVEAHEPRASVSKNRLHYYLGTVSRNSS